MKKAKFVVGSLLLTAGIYTTVHEGGSDMEHSQSQEHELLGKLATGQVSLSTVESRLDANNLDDEIPVVAGSLIVGFGFACLLDSLRETEDTTFRKKEQPGE
jgi:hypothetical protein